MHPEGSNSQIFSQSFLWGVETGPVLKPKRTDSEARRHEDRGLVHNMTEYFENFAESATRALPQTA